MQDWTRYGLPSRREVLRLLGAVAATGVVAGAGGCASALTGTAESGDPLVGGYKAATAQPVPTGTIVSCTATVSSTQNGAVELGYCGLSYEKDSLWRRTLTTTNTDLQALFILLNSYSILRVGGSTADQNVWTPAGAGATFRQIAPSDVTALNNFLNATGYKCIYGINLKGSINGGTTQTTALAVEEVTAVYNTLGSNLLEIEIGNEPDLYTDSSGTKFTWTEYKNAWEPYALAINNALPSVKLSGPTLASTGDIAGWTKYFAADEGPTGPTPRNVGILTQHYYSGDAATHSYTDLLTPDPNLPAALSTLNGYKATYGVPWKMAETSDFYDSAASPNPSRAFASAMWLIDYLFQNIEANGLAINIHGGTDYQFAPINDDGAHTVTRVNALFYGAKMFTSGGYGNAVSTSISSSVTSSAHTIQVDSKHYSTFICNKDTTSSKNMKVVITLPSAVTSATVRVLLSSGDLSSQSGFTINGSAIGIDGSFSPAADQTLTVSGSTVTVYVPFNSMVLVKSVLS